MRPINNGVPLIGQQQVQQQVMAQQVVLNTYLTLVPVVAGRMLEQAGLLGDQEALPERIAEEAWKIAAAAVRRVGIDVAAKTKDQ